MFGTKRNVEYLHLIYQRVSLKMYSVYGFNIELQKKLFTYMVVRLAIQWKYLALMTMCISIKI